jgi:site-specific recombinase XerD
MKHHSFSILFWLYKDKIQDNTDKPIYARITINGKRAEISIQRSVPESSWDQKAQKVKSRHKDCVTINGYIDMMKGKFQMIYNQLIASGEEDITAMKIKKTFLGKPLVEEVKPKHKTICEAFDYHNLKMEETLKVGKVCNKTWERYKITKNKVVAFMEKQYKVSDMELPAIRLRFVTEFEHYLLTTDKLQSNTAHKYIKNLKKIMNMSVGLDWIPSNPFNQFKCSYQSPDREILNREELAVVQFKKLGIPRLEEVRDVFIFCCYTGFAFSDIFQFEQNAVTIGLDGEYWLSTNRQKTGTKESVPLLPVALEIIAKYKNHPYCVSENKLLPVNSNQRYNSYLKELADICNINKHLTSHIARHTFATTVTLANGVPIETVSSMLGHTSIRTTQIYAKVVEEKVSSDMKLLRQKLSVVFPNQKAV